MKFALIFWFLILLPFSFIYPQEIYPSRVKKRIKATYYDIKISQYDGTVFKVRKGAYISCILYMPMLFVLLGFGGFLAFVTEGGYGYKILGIVLVLFWGAGIVFCLRQLIYDLPKRELEYKNGIIYYCEGSKERVIKEITDIDTQYDYRSSYWKIYIELPDEKKKFLLDFMSFNNPEVVYKIILSKLDREYKREILLKSIMR